MRIYEMTEVTDEVVAAFAHLIPLLTSYSQPPSRATLAELAASPSTIIFLARHPETGDEIVGAATLALTQTPTGRHGWIEDVVVKDSARRLGVGLGLTSACLDRARALGLRQVFLTSRPDRTAANRLYQAMGFYRRETNVYGFDLD